MRAGDGVNGRLHDGDAVVRLAYTGWTWIGRRTDRVEFVDEMTIRRTTTVEIDLPPSSFPRLPRKGGHVFLPVATLHRTAAYDVTAHGPDDARLQVLPRETERRYVAEGILARLLDESRTEMDSADLDGALEAVWAAISGRGDCSEVLEAFPEPAASIGWAMLEWWTTRFLVLVALKPDQGAASDGLRSTVVLEQHEPFPDDRTPTANVPSETGNAPLPSTAVRWLYETDNIDAAASYHFDLLAPPATAVVYSTMRFAIEEGEGENMSARIIELHEPRSEKDRKRVSLAWSHQRARLQATDGSLTVGSSAVITVAFVPLPHGNLMAGRIAAWASSISLLFLAAVSLIDAFTSRAEFAWRVDSNSIVTMLLIGPTLLIGVIVQREEGHFMTRRILRSTRTMLVACAVMTFLSAMLVAVGADAGWLAGLLVLPVVFCFVFALGVELAHRGSVSGLRGAGPRSCAGQMASRCTGPAYIGRLTDGRDGGYHDDASNKEV